MPETFRLDDAQVIMCIAANESAITVLIDFIVDPEFKVVPPSEI